MQIAPQPDNEETRLNALCQLQVLDTEPETAFDDLTQLAATICNTPIALISLVDAHRQWFKSKVGSDVSETPRDIAFCSHTILQATPLIVSDTRADQRFATNPLVLAPPHIRFYAGVPLITTDNHALGTLCVIDLQPRELSPQQIDSLQVLARQVVAQLELRQKVMELEQVTQDYQHTEAALRESEERFRTMADSAAVLMWVDDAAQNPIFFNQTWLRFTGRSLDQEIKHWPESMHPEDFQRWSETYTLAFKTRQPYTIEYRLQRADSEYRWMLETGVPRFLPDGTFAGFIGSCFDITERKIAEQDIRLLQTVTQAIFASPDFHSALQIALEKVCEATQWDFGEAWIPNPDQTVMVCSPAWYSKEPRLLEFRQQSESFTFPPGIGIPGRVWRSKQPEWHRDVSTEDNTSYLRAQLAQTAGLKAALGIPLLAHEDVITVLVFYMFEARAEDQRLIDLISASTELGLFIQRKQAEEDMRQSLAKEQELHQLKSNFISVVSHEFRTPLTSIVMSAEMLEQAGPNLAPDKRSLYFNRIRKASRRMTQLLEDVLLIGQGEGGKLEFNPTWINLEQICQELVDELQGSTSDQHILILTCQGQLQRVYMDANLLRHLFTNLLTNAIKYSPAGGTVLFTIEEQDGMACCSIQDSGIGIPFADQEKLFTVFHRATNVCNIPGTGLGLSIVKQCVDLHGGQISVASHIGTGTTFTVTLPLQIVNKS